jgi:hypothetical protein
MKNKKKIENKIIKIEHIYQKFKIKFNFKKIEMKNKNFFLILFLFLLKRKLFFKNFSIFLDNLVYFKI